MTRSTSNNLPIADKWYLDGATYLHEKVFHFVGDLEEDTYKLKFLVNEKPVSFDIPQPLKGLGTISDQVKNGYLYYHIGSFKVDENSILYIESTWQSDEQTTIFYTPMPYDASTNTMILCDSFETVLTSITNTNIIGVKAIGSVLAIRLSTAECGITLEDSEKEKITKASQYLRTHSFNILYELNQAKTYTFPYSFEVATVDNVITCENSSPPKNFLIEYPIEVVIQTTVDIRQIQAIGNQVAQDRVIVQNLKIEVENALKTINQQYEQILGIQETLETELAKIIEIEKTIKAIEKQVEEAKKAIAQQHQDITEMAKTIAIQKESVDNALIEILKIQSELKNLLKTHNEDSNAHPALKKLIIANETSILALQEKNATFESHINLLQTDVSSLKNTTTTLQTDVKAVKNTTTALQTDIEAIENRLLIVEDKFPLLDAKVADLETTQTEHSQLFSSILNESQTNIDLSLIPFTHPKIQATNLYDALNELLSKITLQ